jgi:hypothetical protein
VSLPASHLIDDDSSGHTLIATYLNQKRETYTKVRSLIQNALDELIVPDTHGR